MLNLAERSIAVNHNSHRFAETLYKIRMQGNGYYMAYRTSPQSKSVVDQHGKTLRTESGIVMEVAIATDRGEVYHSIWKTVFSQSLLCEGKPLVVPYERKDDFFRLYNKEDWTGILALRKSREDANVIFASEDYPINPRSFRFLKSHGFFFVD